VLDLPALVDRLTWGPAQIIDHARTGLGTLRPGAPGDIAVFDANAPWTVETGKLLSKGKNTPLGGRVLRGRVVATIYAGALVYQAGQAVVHGA
jgi:dihydroorotase